MSANSSSTPLTSVMAMTELSTNFHLFANKNIFEVCIIPIQPLEVLQIFAAVHADEDAEDNFSTKYCLLNMLSMHKDNERKRELPSQLNVLMSSADREVGLPEISLNLCLEASLSSYVYHEPTAFSQTAYIFQALPYSYGTNTNQTFRNKDRLKDIFKYLRNASNRKGK